MKEFASSFLGTVVAVVVILVGLAAVRYLEQSLPKPAPYAIAEQDEFDRGEVFIPGGP